jgi:hypothetical protein
MTNEHALRRDGALANRIVERLGLSNAFGHDSLSATVRVKIAGPDPGEYGAVIFTALDGKLRASAASHNSAATTATRRTRHRRFIVYSIAAWPATSVLSSAADRTAGGDVE